jgi:putative sigma-54 modulation protein
MQINVTGKHMDITMPIEEYAHKKCDRLTRFYDRIQGIDVLVDKPTREFEVEIITHVDHHDPFVGTCQGEDIYACIDDAIDKLTRQLSDHKEKLRNRKH